MKIAKSYNFIISIASVFYMNAHGKKLLVRTVQLIFINAPENKLLKLIQM